MNVRRMESNGARQRPLPVGKPRRDPRQARLEQDSALTTFRRSLYYRHAPEKQAEFLRLFDAANVNECYERSESIIRSRRWRSPTARWSRLSRRRWPGSFPRRAPATTPSSSWPSRSWRPPSDAERRDAEFLQEGPGPGAGHVLFNHNNFVTIR
jgi:hypothetical protein